MCFEGAVDYFLGLQVHSFAGFLQPEQTRSLISRPHALHGLHPQAWHMAMPPFAQVTYNCRLCGEGTPSSELGRGGINIVSAFVARDG